MYARSIAVLALALSACKMSQAPMDAQVGSAASTVLVPEEPFAEACTAWDEWDKPARPFQLMGNSWYVGTCGISVILITGEEGHILIDSGVEVAVPLVLANVRHLGFDPDDIRYILMNHEHFDHVGGHAALAAATGAEVLASPLAAPVLESGYVAGDDPQAMSEHPTMKPVEVARIIEHGETVSLGKIAVTAHLTPGHTPGGMSWSWWACSLPGEPPVCRRMAYADSLSPVSSDAYRFSDHPDYVARFRTAIDTVRAMPCDTLVTPHPSAGRLIERLRDGTFGQFGECARYADALTRRLDARLAKEAER